MGTVLEEATQRLPRTTNDWFAFLFLLFGIHSVLVFELFVVLPYVYHEHHNSTAMYYFHITAALFIYLNVMCNLFMLITTYTGVRGVVLPAVLKPGWNFCSTCECNSPPRSYHCHTCKTCVLKRDHHCTFSGCCVGHRNQRYYFVMVFYVWMAALYATVMNVDFVYHIFGEFSLKTAFCLIVPLLAWLFQIVETVTMTMAFMTSLCLISLLLTTALLGYHFINIVNGQTVHEKTHKVTIYNVGLIENIKSVFGPKWTICWLCPWIASPPVGDGLSFAQKFERDKDI